MYRKTPQGKGKGVGERLKWPLTELIVHFNLHQGTIITLGNKIITQRLYIYIKKKQKNISAPSFPV